jgi:hypothetical protein
MGKKHGSRSRLPRYKKPKTNQTARTDSGLPERHRTKSRGLSKSSSSQRKHRRKKNWDLDYDDESSGGDADDEQDDLDSYEDGYTRPPKKEKPKGKAKPKQKGNKARTSLERDPGREFETPQSRERPVGTQSKPPQNLKSGKERGGHALKFDIIELDEATKLWLDYSRNNFGMFSKTAYEYNIFVAKHQRLLVAVPSGGNSDNVRESEKPKSFAINTPHGTEVCKLQFTTGNCFRRSTSIDVTMDREIIGGVRQDKNRLLVTEQAGNLLFEVHGVPLLGLCNQMGPDRFKSEIYFPGENQIAGAIGRNGSLMSDVIIGEPSGFYFLARKSDAIEFDMLHKLLILSILITLMTQYAD